MITIPFKYQNKDYSVSWTDEESLKFFAFFQHGTFMTGRNVNDFTLSEFYNIYSGIITGRLAFFEPVFSQLPQNANILNVGCGVGTIELILSQIYNWKFYVVDKTSMSIRKNKDIKYYGANGDEHGFYNSWDILKDGIKTSGIDKSRFVMLNPEDAWPKDLDLIMSSYSWGWHYPLNVYWDRVSLAPNGRIMLDILNNEHSSKEIELITNRLEREPVERPYTVVDTSRFKDQHLLKNGNSHGSNYYW